MVIFCLSSSGTNGARKNNQSSPSKSDMGIEIAFVVMLVVGLAVFYWIIVRNASRKISKQYEKMAYQLRVKMTEPQPQLAGFIRPEPFVHGMYRGRAMSISVPGKGLQNTRQIETTLKIEVDDKKIQWQMTAKGLLSNMRQRDSAGMERWQSENNIFDLAMDVRTNEPARLTRILHDERLEQIRAVLKGNQASIYLGEGMMVYTKFGLIADDRERERFLKVTELFCDLAEVIEGR